MTQEELNALANEFYNYLANQKDFYEVWPSEDDTICVDISWGDWKHDHLRLDLIANNFFKEKGYDILNMNTEVTDEDGSDTYSATHSYRIRKHEEEPKEYKMVDSNSVKVEEESLCEEDSKDALKKERDELWSKMPDCTKDEIQRLIDIRKELGDDEFYTENITREALKEEYIPGVGTINTTQECEEKIKELVKKRDSSKDGWWKKELLKDINKLVKLKAKLKASENGEYVTTNKLYNDLYKIAGLEKIETKTTAIRGYRPITHGQIEIQNYNGDTYDIYFYSKREKIPEVVEELKKLGYNVKNHSDMCITVFNYIPRDKETTENLKEESHGKGYRIAKVIAKALEGQCGPFGGEDPYLYGNELVLHSQGDDEKWIFNDDGSVDSANDAEEIINDESKWDNYGFESKEEARDYFEEIKHFNNVRDLFNSGLSWFEYVPNEDEVLRKIDEIVKGSVDTTSSLKLENPKLVSWKEMYLNDVCGGDEDQYNELYADMWEDDEEFGDSPCQVFYDVVDDKGHHLGRLGVYKFETQIWTYEVGFEPNARYLNIDKLDLQDLDLPVDGWFDDEHVNQNLVSEEEYRKVAEQFLPKIESALEYPEDDDLEEDLQDEYKYKLVISDYDLYIDDVDGLDDFDEENYYNEYPSDDIHTLTINLGVDSDLYELKDGQWVEIEHFKA